ncbi:MAG: D-alanyl-D-alanine carboxypeptidase [Clostridia bacterium]|nr:D-alanyl-D-alanine carboxypeptidase [Clostridia bacterium]
MKKIIVLLFSLILCLCFAIPVNAYRINDYEMHHEAGMIIYLDRHHGDKVIYEKDADKRLYPASITKLMTALVMVDAIPDLDNTKITYSNTANEHILGTGSVILNLAIGEEITAKDALAALLIKSCGDVAYAIAEQVGGSTEGFVDMMNQKAIELELDDSHFTNPVGLHHDDHYTTARDIYKIATAAFANPSIKEFCSTSRYTVPPTNMSAERYLVNSNMLLNPNSDAYYRYAVAGKTGFTDEAGRCLVALASYGGYDYMSIVLGTTPFYTGRNDFKDTANMFRWAFNNFEYKTVFEPNTPVTEAPIELARDTDFLPVCFEGGLETLLPVDADASTLTFDVKLTQESYVAPVEKGTVVGTADIYYAEEKIGTLNLVAGDTVKADFWLVLWDWFKRFVTSPFMLVVYCVIGVCAVIFSLWVIILNRGSKKQRKVKYIPLKKDEFNDFDIK